LVSTLPVGSGPADIAINSKTDLIYIANENDNTISVVNGSSLPPAVPILLSPSNGSVQVSLSPALSWNDSCNVVSYVAELSNSALFNAPFDTTLSGTTVSTRLTPNTTYFWHVKASNQYGTSPWSATNSFTTGFLPDSIRILSPPDDSPVHEAVLKWYAANHAGSYHVQIATSLAFNQVGLDTTIFDTLFTAAVSGETKYYWKVYGINSFGNGPSSIDSFSTDWIDVFKAPSMSLFWDYDTSHSVKITIYDSSNCETGYRIYRRSDSSFPYVRIAQIVSAVPARNDIITFFDSSTTPNQDYDYIVAAWRPGDSVFAVPASIFTFKSLKPQSLIQFSKLSDFHIALAGWSARAGDSIVYKDSTSPVGKFNVISMKNPSYPRLVSYLDSATLGTYALQTMIPAYLKFDVYNDYGPGARNVIVSGNKAVVFRNGKFSMYNYSQSQFTLLDTLGIDDPVLGVLPLNDSMLGISEGNTGVYGYVDFSTLNISNSKFIQGPVSTIGWWDSHVSYECAYNPCVRGLINNKIIIPVTWQTSYPDNYFGNDTGGQYVTLYDINTGSTSDVPGTFPGTFSSNSGYYFTPKQFLSLDSLHIYSEDIGDLDGYHPGLFSDSLLWDTAAHRHNVLIDTLKKQLFIVYSNNISAFSYSLENIGIKKIDRILSPTRKYLQILSGPGLSISILFPQNSHSSDLYFYDLSGRLIDRIVGITSNEVTWRPKCRASGCCFVVVQAGGKIYRERFFLP
jgi:hypothetical protein